MTDYLCRRNSSYDDAYYLQRFIEDKLSLISLDDRKCDVAGSRPQRSHPDRHQWAKQRALFFAPFFPKVSVDQFS